MCRIRNNPDGVESFFYEFMLVVSVAIQATITVMS
jgi:hypothetical protein